MRMVVYRSKEEVVLWCGEEEVEEVGSMKCLFRFPILVLCMCVSFVVFYVCHHVCDPNCLRFCYYCSCSISRENRLI